MRQDDKKCDKICTHNRAQVDERGFSATAFVESEESLDAVLSREQLLYRPSRYLSLMLLTNRLYAS